MKSQRTTLLVHVLFAVGIWLAVWSVTRITVKAVVPPPVVYTYKTKGFVDKKHIDIWVRVVQEDKNTFVAKDWTAEKDRDCIEISHDYYYKTKFVMGGLAGPDNREAFVMEFNQ